MEKVIFTGSQLSALFKNHVVMVENQPTAPHVVVEKTIQVKPEYKGGYEKKILWMHEETTAPFINEEDVEMLTKILEACRLGWNDIALVNLANKTDKSEVLNLLDPVYIIDSSQDSELERYDVLPRSSARILYTHTLCEIRKNKNLKILLWNALKVLFNLS